MVPFMKTVTLPLRLPKKLLEEIDSLVKAGLYESRSEAIRDAARRLIESKKLLLEPYRYYRLRVEEAVRSSAVPTPDPDKVIEELKTIREELWRRGKTYFES
jgi:Arc/MetJ-type ribon-helix-helix transcriptional regulator